MFIVDAQLFVFAMHPFGYATVLVGFIPEEVIVGWEQRQCFAANRSHLFVRLLIVVRFKGAHRIRTKRYGYDASFGILIVRLSKFQRREENEQQNDEYHDCNWRTIYTHEITALLVELTAHRY